MQKIPNLPFFVILCYFIIIYDYESYSQVGNPLRMNQNFRIYPGKLDQTEVFIEVHTNNPDVLWVSCNTLNFSPFFVSEGIYTSEDGGQSWQGSDTCSGNPISFHGGDPGISINQNGTFILTRLGRAPFTGLYSHYSTDQGKSWSAQKAISTDDLERAALTTNLVNGSTSFGRTLAAWIKFASPFPLMIAHTDDGGQSWSTPRQLNQPPRRSAGGDIAVGPNGEFYICWAGVTDVTPFKEVQAGFAASSDGGITWAIQENAFPMNGITGKFDEKGGIRVNGLPAIDVDVTGGPRNGWIYIVTGQKGLAPAGNDPDIVLNRSTDGGATWSAGIRVNQDPLNNGKIQYFPAIHVDHTGAVNVLFYDDRNTTPDSCSVMLARSTDGGVTWSEYLISDHNYKPIPIGGLAQGYQGDNIDLTSTPTHLWPVWMDNRTGVYQVWTAPVAFSQIGVPEQGSAVAKPSLCRLFPNPVGDVATFEYTLPGAGDVTLSLHDALGSTIAVVENDTKSRGTYRKEIRLSTLVPAGGMLFYRFQWNDRIEGGKLVVVRP